MRIREVETASKKQVKDPETSAHWHDPCIFRCVCFMPTGLHPVAERASTGCSSESLPVGSSRLPTESTGCCPGPVSPPPFSALVGAQRDDHCRGHLLGLLPVRLVFSWVQPMRGLQETRGQGERAAGVVLPAPLPSCQFLAESPLSSPSF